MGKGELRAAIARRDEVAALARVADLWLNICDEGRHWLLYDGRAVQRYLLAWWPSTGRWRTATGLVGASNDPFRVISQALLVRDHFDYELLRNEYYEDTGFLPMR